MYTSGQPVARGLQQQPSSSPNMRSREICHYATLLGWVTVHLHRSIYIYTYTRRHTNASPECGIRPSNTATTRVYTYQACVRITHIHTAVYMYVARALLQYNNFTAFGAREWGDTEEHNLAHRRRALLYKLTAGVCVCAFF